MHGETLKKKKKKIIYIIILVTFMGMLHDNFLHVSNDNINCVWYTTDICKYMCQLKQGKTVTCSVRPLGK